MTTSNDQPGDRWQAPDYSKLTNTPTPSPSAPQEVPQQQLTPIMRAILCISHWDLHYHGLLAACRSVISSRRCLSMNQEAVLTSTLDELSAKMESPPPKWPTKEELTEDKSALTAATEEKERLTNLLKSAELYAAEFRKERDQFRAQLTAHQEWGGKAREALSSYDQLAITHPHLWQLKGAEALTSFPTDSTRPKDGPGDGEMLDWLDKHVSVAAKYQAKPPASDHTGPVYWSFNWSQWRNNEENSGTLRSAIRAAMQSQEKAPDSTTI